VAHPHPWEVMQKSKGAPAAIRVRVYPTVNLLAVTSKSSIPGLQMPGTGDTLSEVGNLTELLCFGKERRVIGMIETNRRILSPTRGSANWRCSDCAWSQPFVQRSEVVANEPPKAIGDAFDRHKCAEHRHPKWVRAAS